MLGETRSVHSEICPLRDLNCCLSSFHYLTGYFDKSIILLTTASLKKISRKIEHRAVEKAIIHTAYKELLKLRRLSMKKLIFLIVLFLISSYSYADEKRYPVPLENSPSFGPEHALVTIIEFLDYQ
jgi:hypothetical protein